MEDKNKFEELLSWLDSDRERAGERYEKIRYGLITMFSARQCSNPEELSDIVIERVTRKIQDIKTDYSGVPEKYFFGVARNVFMESLRKKELQFDEELIKQRTQEIEPSNAELDCMKKCLEELPNDKKQTVVEYFENLGTEKVEHHQSLADKLNLSINALRLQIFRAKANLKNCLEKCRANG